MATALPFLARLGRLPEIFDAARVARSEQALAEAGISFGNDVRALLNAIFGSSPFLTRTILRDPAMLADIFALTPEQALEKTIGDLQRAMSRCAAPDEAMRILRQTRARFAVIVALADIGAIWTLEDVTRALSTFADACLQGGLDVLLRYEAAAQRIKLANTADPSRDSGLIIIAMGKYGAGELNYSSDIDLIVFFDEALWSAIASDEPQTTAIRVTRALVRLLSEQTSDGYVFRVDLRLRPDAGATQIALSTGAAEAYYESMGQNWERAAMIKARAVAGDRVAGEAFLAGLKPFIWRKHLDFAAIEDVHSIKRQIHAERGHGTIAIEGHNIKLGRGGIREIEFFAQTQQLILGGRDPALRGQMTLGTLDALAARGHISTDARDELREAYIFLRTLEHRLQMVEDSQTHTLPKDPAELDHIARFMGFAQTDAFAARLRTVLETVQKHYAALFEKEAPLAEEAGSLVFTGVEEDPETLETLSALGFKRPVEVSAAIRGWHHGRVRAMRSARARELLTKLVPSILRAFARTAAPDTAFFRFSRFLENLPAGVQLFSMLMANPALLDLLALVLGTAPRFATYLAQHTNVLDALLDPEFVSRLPSEDELGRTVAKLLADTRGFEDMLETLRRFAHEERFRIGFQILSGTVDAEDAGRVYAALAARMIAGLLPVVENEFASRHGCIPGASLAILAMGKLGSREMTAASDLDLIFIYDAPEVESSGPRPLSPSEYYARLTQRVVNALTAPTRSGALYPVDMRLRPSGNAGPIATRLQSFAQYQMREAWTWEHMALLRARPIAGDEKLGRQVADIVRNVLTKPRDPANLAADVREMRARIAKEYPSKDVWELKYVRGGLVDLEFIAQHLMLVHAHHSPGVIQGNIRAALKALTEAGALGAEDFQALDDAAALLHALMQILRVAVDGPFKPEEAGPALAGLLCRATGMPSLARLEAHLVETERSVFERFERIVAV